MMTDEQRKLVSDNHQLIFSFLNTYGYDQEDYYDIAAIALCDAAKAWNPERGAFSTYAYRSMLNAIKHDLIYKTRAKRIPEELIDSYDYEICNECGETIDILSLIPSSTNIEKEVLDKVAVESFMAKLSDIDREIFGLLVEGYGLREIGKIIGLNRNAVSKHKERIALKILVERGDVIKWRFVR